MMQKRLPGHIPLKFFYPAPIYISNKSFRSQNAAKFIFHQNILCCITCMPVPTCLNKHLPAGLGGVRARCSSESSVGTLHGVQSIRINGRGRLRISGQTVL